MDEDGSLYVADQGKHEVRRYRRGESQGIVVAGGSRFRKSSRSTLRPTLRTRRSRSFSVRV